MLGLITKAHHDELVGELRRQVSALETDLHRLYDLIFQQQFGVQIYGTITKESSAPIHPEPALTPEQEAERELEQERQRERAHLASIRRTNPSRLGSALQSLMQRDSMRRARAAHPQHTSPAQAVFEKARAEVS